MIPYILTRKQFNRAYLISGVMAILLAIIMQIGWKLHGYFAFMTVMVLFILFFIVLTTPVRRRHDKNNVR